MSAQSNYDAAAVDSVAMVDAVVSDNLQERLAAKVANDTLIAGQNSGAVEPKVNAQVQNSWSPERVATVTALR